MFLAQAFCVMVYCTLKQRRDEPRFLDLILFIYQSQKRINKYHYHLILAASPTSQAVACFSDFQWFIINDTTTQKSCYISLYCNLPKVKQCIIQTDVNYFEMKKKKYQLAMNMFFNPTKCLNFMI